MYKRASRFRSEAYQWKICERPFDFQVWAESPNFAYDPVLYEQEILELRDELIVEVKRVMQDVLTKNQYEILMLYLEGKTQCEIAKQLGVNQSSVNKSVRGNFDYKKNQAYGGAYKKLSKACKKDNKIQELLSKIAELQNI